MVEIDRLPHAIRAHAHIAFTQGEAGNDLPLDREIPLRGLRVAVIGERVLVEVARAGDGCGIIGRARAGELIRGLSVGERIGGSADDRDVNIGGVERQLAQIGHRKDAEAAAKNRPVVGNGPIGEAQARL